MKKLTDDQWIQELLRSPHARSYDWRVTPQALAEDLCERLARERYVTCRVRGRCMTLALEENGTSRTAVVEPLGKNSHDEVVVAVARLAMPGVRPYRIALLDRSDTWAYVLLGERDDAKMRKSLAGDFDRLLRPIAGRAPAPETTAEPACAGKRRDSRVDRLTKGFLGLQDDWKREETERAAKEHREAVADPGTWRIAFGRCGRHAMGPARLGMRDVLRGHPAGWEAIERRVYRSVYEGIANPFALAGLKVGTRAAYMLYLDELDLAKRYLARSEKAEGASRALGKRTHAGNFMVVLAARALGTKKKLVERELGVYEQVLAHWNDAKAFAKAIEAACEYHLTGTGSSDLAGEFEDMELVPIELAAVRGVREKEGLAFPASDHPLLTTPLAGDPAPRDLPTGQGQDAPAVLEGGSRRLAETADDTMLFNVRFRPTDAEILDPKGARQGFLKQLGEPTDAPARMKVADAAHDLDLQPSSRARGAACGRQVGSRGGGRSGRQGFNARRR